MSEGSIFEDHFRLSGVGAGLRPTLGQIGLDEFPPYLINGIFG